MLLATCYEDVYMTQTLPFEKDMLAKSYGPRCGHYKKQDFNLKQERWMVFVRDKAGAELRAKLHDRPTLWGKYSMIFLRDNF